MKFKLVRDTFTAHSTTGILYLNNKKLCYTLEDVVRVVKIHGETAIPEGTYDIEQRFSPHFQRIMPMLANVPGFKYVYLHKGNTDKDTEGCILVGLSRDRDRVILSNAAYKMVMRRVEAAWAANEKITIEITSETGGRGVKDTDISNAAAIDGVRSETTAAGPKTRNLHRQE